MSIFEQQFMSFKSINEALLKEAHSHVRFNLDPIVQQVAEEVQKDFKKSLPQSLFEKFLASRALAAAELSLTKINYFSAALGARINAKFTSPTAAPSARRREPSRRRARQRQRRRAPTIRRESSIVAAATSSCCRTSATRSPAPLPSSSATGGSEGRRGPGKGRSALRS